MTKRDIKIQRPLPKRLRQISIMRIKKMIIQLKANPQHTIRHLIIPLPNIKQTLAKLSTQIQRRSAVEAEVVVVLVLVQLDAETPAGFPCFFVRGAG